jgi:hypothetical protein
VSQKSVVISKKQAVEFLNIRIALNRTRLLCPAHYMQGVVRYHLRRGYELKCGCFRKAFLGLKKDPSPLVLADRAGVIWARKGTRGNS